MLSFARSRNVQLHLAMRRRKRHVPITPHDVLWDETGERVGVRPRHERLAERAFWSILGDTSTELWENMCALQRFLQEYDETPHSRAGRYVLEYILTAIWNEAYGDFERSTDCMKCGSGFTHELTVEYAVALMTHGQLCPDCRVRATEHPPKQVRRAPAAPKRRIGGDATPHHRGAGSGRAARTTIT